MATPRLPLHIYYPTDNIFIKGLAFFTLAKTCVGAEVILRLILALLFASHFCFVAMGATLVSFKHLLLSLICCFRFLQDLGDLFSFLSWSISHSRDAVGF